MTNFILEQSPKSTNKRQKTGSDRNNRMYMDNKDYQSNLSRSESQEPSANQILLESIKFITN